MRVRESIVTLTLASWAGLVTSALTEAGQSSQPVDRDLFGAALAALDDLDGDGVDEILVTAPLSHGGRGSVWVLSGARQTPLVRIVGEASKRWLGVEACEIGDVDGDGSKDIAASWRGGPSELGGLAICSSVDGRPLMSIEGASLGLRLGNALGNLGDFDGDGIADVTALAQDEDGWSKRATLPRFVVFSGADGHELARVEDVSGIKRSEAGLFTVGDMDGDGRTDLALFAAQADIEGPDARIEPACVQVYSGKDLRLLLRLEGNAQQCDFGRAVAGAGDVDADGRTDLLVGFPRFSYREAEGFPSSAHVVSGSDGHGIWEYQAESSHRDGMGRALSSAGDVDEDGHADFLIASDGLEQSVWLCSGRTGELLRRWTGDKDEWHFGEVLASLGDLDGDCVRDVAIARGSWSHPDLPGRVRLFSSRSGALLGSLDLGSLESRWSERETRGVPSGQKR